MWVEVSHDYVPNVGDVIKQVFRGVNTTGIPYDDNRVISELENLSNEEIEDRIYRETGAKVKVRNKRVTVITSGFEYQYEVEYEVVEISSPTLWAIAAIIIGLIALLITLDWFMDRNLKLTSPTDGNRRNLFGIILLLVIFIILIYLLKKK